MTWKLLLLSLVPWLWVFLFSCPSSILYGVDFLNFITFWGWVGGVIVVVLALALKMAEEAQTPTVSQNMEFDVNVEYATGKMDRSHVERLDDEVCGIFTLEHDPRIFRVSCSIANTLEWHLAERRDRVNIAVQKGTNLVVGFDLVNIQFVTSQ